MIGGADTSGIILCTIFYHVLKNPGINRRLRTALREANLVYSVAFKDAKDISYLAAVVSEALRIHPPIGSVLERVVSTEGLILPGGEFLPPGTLVGMNAWVVNTDRTIFGSDADQFVPERWLQRDGETTAEWKARIWRMRECDLTFGGGKRGCLGKNLAAMKIYKTAATIFSLYEVSVDLHSRNVDFPFPSINL